MPDFQQKAYDIANTSDMGQALINYLRTRNVMPKIEPAYLGDETAGDFMRYPAGQTTQYPSGRLRLGLSNLNTPFAKSVVAHELAHAGDWEMSNQYFENPRENSQFHEAYRKLNMGEPYQANRRTTLALLMAPKWLKENEGYRSNSGELGAFAVGNMSGSNPYETNPPHLDATLAQEYAVLLDLAQRRANALRNPK